ncbi:MAG: hypothetical protein AABW67_00640 [Nanoarchaeota archaeon]
MGAFKFPNYGKPHIEQDVKAAITLVHTTFKSIKKSPTLEEISNFCFVHKFPIPNKKDFELAIQQKYIVLENNTYVLNEIAYSISNIGCFAKEDYKTKKRDCHHIFEVNKATRKYLHENHKEKEVLVTL